MLISRKFLSKIVFFAIIIFIVLLSDKIIKATNIFSNETNFYFQNNQIVNTKSTNIEEIPDDDTVYVNNNKDVLFSDILIIGDSYAYNFLYYTKIDCRFVVKIGYTIANIKDELLKLADFTGIKYCIIFIGPNDYMQQTAIQDFHYYFKSMCEIIIGKGVKPVLISYMGVPYRDYEITDMQYKATVYNLSMEIECIYVDLSEFDKICDRNVADNFVHHHMQFNILSFNKIINSINVDRNKGS